MDNDSDHLHWLSIAYVIVGILTALTSCLPLIHLFIGLAIINGKFPGNGQFPGVQEGGPPPELIGWILVVVALLLIVMGLIFSGCIFYAGRLLHRRRGYTFCMVIAVISLMFFPFGTCLGVFTLIVLLRPSVKALFLNRVHPDSIPPNEYAH